MPVGEPVNLAAASIVALLGVALGIWLIVRLVLEYRRKRALLADMPSWSAYDGDVQRYLRRVWLLNATWSGELPVTDGVDSTMDEIFAMADELQAARAAGQEAGGLIAEMVRLENQLEAEIESSRRPPE